MESLIETILSFIPIALIIALRIAASKRNQQQIQDRSRIVDVIKTKAVKTTRVDAVPQGYKSAFVFEESAHPPIAHWDASSTAKPIDINTPIEPAIIDTSAITENVTTISPETTHYVREKVSKKSTAYDPLNRLSHLSRLQQAVVYAELLGSPKSLREDI